MDNVENILEKLYEFFGVINAAELSEKIQTSQKTISNWKVRNSIGAVKKKCRELGIYNEIFGDLNSNSQNISSNRGNVSQTGNVNINNKDNDNYKEIDEVVFAMFKKTYKKCLNDNNEIIEDKVDELISYLMKFK